MREVRQNKRWPVYLTLSVLAITGLVFRVLTVNAADQYFAGDGSSLSAAKWGTSPGGPFTSTFTNGNLANFSVPGGTGTGGSINVAGLNATDDFTITSPSGTISNLNNGVVPITVTAGKTLDLGAQTVTSSATAGYTFTGPGTLALSGNTYGGGFTINSGAIVARGTNAMGVGALTVNGGTIAANGSRDFSGRFPGGIVFGGDLQLGALASAVPLSSDTANLIFTNSISLGGSSRTVVIGANGNYTLGGMISGSAGSGLVVEALPAAVGRLILTGNNSYSGPTRVNSGTLALNASGALPNTPTIEVAGGTTFDLSGRSSTLTLSSTQTFVSSGQTSTATLKTGSGIGLVFSGASGLQFNAFDPAVPPLTTASGTGSITLNSGNIVNVTIHNGGIPISAGDHKLIAKGTGGGVMGTIPSNLMVSGDISTGALTSLVISGSELYLRVTAAPTPTPTLSPTASPTATQTATPTATPTGTPTSTPTASPTLTPNGTPSIIGSVNYAVVPKPVPGALVNAKGSVILDVFTDAAGNYGITGFGAGPYTVTPSKLQQDCAGEQNGIFANDASLISRYVVGQITLSPDQLIAAKVSGDITPFLSSLDAAFIAQKIVGICSEANLSGRWKFDPEKIVHPDGVSGQTTENYRAYLMGDVNGDWDPGPTEPDIAPSTDPPFIASLPSVWVEHGVEFAIDLRLDGLHGSEVQAYQFNLAFDPNVIQPAFDTATVAGTVDESLTVVSNPSMPGVLKVAVYGAVSGYGDGPYLYLRFKSVGQAGSTTDLRIENFVLNSGNQRTSVRNGRISVVPSH